MRRPYFYLRASLPGRKSPSTRDANPALYLPTSVSVRPTHASGSQTRNSAFGVPSPLPAYNAPAEIGFVSHTCLPHGWQGAPKREIPRLGTPTSRLKALGMVFPARLREIGFVCAMPPRPRPTGLVPAGFVGNWVRFAQSTPAGAPSLPARPFPDIRADLALFGALARHGSRPLPYERKLALFRTIGPGKLGSFCTIGVGLEWWNDRIAEWWGIPAARIGFVCTTSRAGGRPEV
jgi:hypothetical protein